MNFYIASSLKNYEQVRALSGLLKKAGWVHTYDWTVHCEEMPAGIAALRAIGEAEYEGIRRADVVIVLTPQGKGTHTELGISIALKKTIYLCHRDDTYFKCDENTSTFYWLSQVTQLIGDTEEIADRLVRSE